MAVRAVSRLPDEVQPDNEPTTLADRINLRLYGNDLALQGMVSEANAQSIAGIRMYSDLSRLCELLRTDTIDSVEMPMSRARIKAGKATG